MHSFHSKTCGKKTKREKITDFRKAIHANLANGKKEAFLQILSGEKNCTWKYCNINQRYDNGCMSFQCNIGH